MPAILVITKEAAKMQSDAIEATQIGRYSGVTGGLDFVIDCHIPFFPFLRNRTEFLTMGGTKVPHVAAD